MTTTSLRTWAALVCLGLLLASYIPARAAVPANPAPATAPEASAATPAAATLLDGLPMAFEPNVGQTDASVRYVARGRGYDVLVTGDDVTLVVEPRREAATSPASLRMQFAGARPDAAVEAVDELPGRVHYMRGADPSRWLRDVPTYAAVRYAGVYEGVDAVLYGTRRQLEYDFEVAPGADPTQIRVRFEGAEAVEVDPSGDLVMRLADGEVRQQRAVVYQPDGASRKRVGARYVMTGGAEVRIDLDAYDAERPLVIDPVIVYTTLVGGSDGMSGSNEEGHGVALAPDGSIFVTGSSDANSVPGGFPMHGTPGGDFDVFVTKLDATGTTVLSSTWFGGSNREDASAIAVDSTGAVYVTGTSQSADLPVANAFDASRGGTVDAFVLKLDPSGANTVYATYLGGANVEEGKSIAVDASGSVLVTGETRSTDFPTANAYDATYNDDVDTFLTKLAPNGASLVYSTYLGGAVGDDRVRAVTVDASGRAIVVGETSSSDFPTANAYDGTYEGSSSFSGDAFVTRFAASGASLDFSTFLGGTGYDYADAVAVDASGAVYVAGSTTSPEFPLVGAVDSTVSQYEAFVTKLAPAGTTLVYSTYLGGTADDHAYGIAVDAAGAAYVTGTTASTNFPVANAFDASYSDFRSRSDVFVSKLATNGASLVYSTYVGGRDRDEAAAIAVDASGRALIVGRTISSDYPTANAIDPTFSLDGIVDDGYDMIVTRLTANGSALGFSTYIGGASIDRGYAVAVGVSGSVYLAGQTTSIDLPATSGEPLTYGGGGDAFVAKLDPADGSLVYLTYLGGAGYEEALGLAVDAAGSAYVTGSTRSTDFPTASPAQATLSGFWDAFVTKLAPDGGSLVYSTYLGGAGVDGGTAIALDAQGRAHVLGSAGAGFPLVNAVDSAIAGESECFVTKLDAAGGSLVYSTYLGGSASDLPGDIAVDAAGAAYVVGSTGSSDFPVTDAYDVTYNNGDIFVSKLTGAGAFGYSTFLGGTNIDFGTAVAVDAAGTAYVTGYSYSTNYPTMNPYDGTLGVAPDGIVTRLNAAGTALLYSTFVGGSGSEFPEDIAVDSAGTITIAGRTGSADYPLLNPVDATTSSEESFVTVIAAQGNALLFSTYLGGRLDDRINSLAVAPGGVIYVAGTTSSVDFPSGGPSAPAEGEDAFLTKLRLTSQLVGSDTPGVIATSTGAWFLRNTASGGSADTVFTYGGGGSLVPIAGDWDGDGDDTPGLYAPATGAFFLKNTNAPGNADIVFTFGAGGLVPIAGDWDGDGDASVGLYNPATGAFFLKNANTPGPADTVLSFGPGGAGITPVTGDWNGDGVDTVGIYVASTGTFFLRNSNTPGSADVTVGFGPTNATPLGGDWNGDGVDTVGVYVPATGAWFLRNSNQPGPADITFSYGPVGTTPLIGNWDGQ